MANITITANDNMPKYFSGAMSGANDIITVNILDGFNGTITVDGMNGDGSTETVIVNIPANWTLKVVNLVEYEGVNEPTFKDYSYEVIDATGRSVGTLSIRGNHFQGVPCFAAGTMIVTEFGDIAVEDLVEGDRVWTRDNGLQTVRWVGSRKIQLNLAAHLAPITIKAGALGENAPSSDLQVSPQHRILVRSSIAQRMFGAEEILVAAKQLLAIEGIEVATEMTEVTYVHILFDRHEIVLANGAETESLYTGPEALRALGGNARREIFEIFPELADADHVPAAARPLAIGRMARNLATRHAQHERALVS